MKRIINNITKILPILAFCSIFPVFVQGQPAKPDVVGGIPSEINSRPWVVALVRKNDLNNRSAQFCGGTIIGSNAILTAAHCVNGKDKKNIQVLSGTQTLSTGGMRQNVVEIIQHPEYNAKNQDNDLAILKLDTSPIGSAIKLTDTAADSDAIQKNLEVIVAGWGYTKDSNNENPIDLFEVKVPLVSYKDCRETYQKINNEVTENMICAGYSEGGKDSCQGDSGGPLFYKNSQNSEGYAQIGIVSWGVGCAEPNQYGVYTWVSKYNKWINNLVKDKCTSSDPKC